MFDPYRPTDLQRLTKSVRNSYRKLDTHRKARRELVEDLVGDGYGKEQMPVCGDEMPVNMLALMIDVYLMYLAGASPQVILPTASMEKLPYIADAESIINKELRVMAFDKTVRRWVLEALMSPVGILKCGLVDSVYIEIIPGQPQPSQDYFADIVDFDDFSYDTDASSWSRVTFMGDRYRVDYDRIRESESINPDGLVSLQARMDAPSQEYGDRVSELSIPAQPEDNSGFRRLAWVWDVALPEEGIVITYADTTDDTVVAPLKVVEWDGVTTTPYHALWFNDVPGQLMPLPPGQVIKSLNRTINALYRKMVAQAKRQKSVGFYRTGETDDAERVQKAKDGDLVPVSDPSMINQVSFGGASQENLAFAMHASDVFSRQAGNLDAMGGLGPQSETYRQDAMIASTVSKKSARMARCVIDATVEVIRDIAHRIWEDPINSYQALRPIPGTRFQVDARLNPGERMVDFEDFEIQIVEFSMQYKSPQERAGEITQLLTQLVFPIMPIIQQQGIGINIQRVFEILSKHLSLPELQLMFDFIGPPMPGSGADSPTKPQNTTRTYERVSRPGASRSGNSQAMQSMLHGGNPQPAERAAMSRPTGV